MAPSSRVIPGGRRKQKSEGWVTKRDSDPWTGWKCCCFVFFFHPAGGAAGMDWGESGRGSRWIRIIRSGGGVARATTHEERPRDTKIGKQGGMETSPDQ